jgi:hypothetical protein
MRTTLDIDDDLLSAAKELARRDGITAGQMVSRLLRRSLTSPAQAGPSARVAKAVGPTVGFLPFPARPGVIATNDHVNALRDAEGV